LIVPQAIEALRTHPIGRSNGVKAELATVKEKKTPKLVSKFLKNIF
jgi:hypothetical protein